MNTATSTAAASAAETFRAGPHQHDATQDDTVTALVLEAPAAVSEARLAEAIETVTRRYEVLRSALVASPVGGPPTQRVFAGPEALEGEARPWSAAPAVGGRVELTASAHVLDAEGLLLLAGELARELTPEPEGGAGDPGSGPGEDGPLQYADIAEWLHDVLTDPEAAAARASQESAHAGFDEAGETVARLRSLSSGQSAADTEVTGTVEAPSGGASEVVRTVKLAGQYSGEETEALFLAAWLVVLHRFGGAQALAVRVRTGLREVPQLESALGPLSVWPALRHEFDAGQTLADVVSVVRAARAAQRENVELISDLSAVNGPLGFSYTRLPEQVDGWSVVSLTARGTGPGIRLDTVCRGDSAELRLDGAQAAGLGADVAGRLLDALVAVLEQGMREPWTRVGRAALGAPAVPLAAAATPTAVGWRDATLPDLVVRAAARAPEATAVRCGSRTLTYSRLLHRADHVAARLNVSPEGVVAVLVPDPVTRLVAQLAVLRAGGAYLVIDPDDPADRMAALLADASADVCLVTADTEPLLSDSGRTLVHVGQEDVEAGETADATTPLRGTSVDPDQLAYLLFTSGSTGRPKPVAVTHRNVVNYLGWLADTGLIGPDTVLPATAAPVFDASLKQLWGPLALGGTVVLPPVGEQPAETLAAALSGIETGIETGDDLAPRAGVTTVNTVPRLWDETLRSLEAADGASGPRERTLDVLLGGEALTADLVERTRRLLPGARLWNLYGPSETTANASAGIVTGGDRVSLGGPVGGTTLHVLDEAMAPVPRGVIGELYIGGAGVARGYAGRSGTTAERFLPDPFSGAAGARLYRTGDLVRLGADGQPEFCGRADVQLKVRGYRVEPGEIEAVLLRHPAVTAAVADARDDRLVAWVVPGPDGPPTVAQLRAHCATALPAYLVPAVFVALDRIPATAQGKTDRRALPDPADGHLEQGGEFTAPRTPVEMVVAEIWRTVLGVTRVGAHDSFFALGGDSIRAMHTVARVRELMGTELPLQELLTAPTVADQANLLLAHDQDGSVRDFAEVFAVLDDAADADDADDTPATADVADPADASTPPHIAGSTDDAPKEQS
ncbi:amino acid adenylation domain-containing protein [Streptomyces lasiicapitis]|uniref:amino acid adenylation domain-containing protein n=1 Tax=Streptomyces lasiicapitis TaxID=1923961 RepID=UPI00332991D0